MEVKTEWSGFPFLIVLLLLLSGCTGGQKIVPDFLIMGAKVFIDKETGFQNVDVGIKDDKIIFIGNSALHDFKARTVIQAHGKILSPGFIGPHTHSEDDLSEENQKVNLPYLLQGVTTVIAGNDGFSPLPIGAKLDQWQRNGIGTNAAVLVGHGTVREKVLGLKDVQPSAEELQQMKDLVSQAMKDGAYGMSTGLFYAPGSYAKSDEVVALSKIVASYSGIYDTHMRDESSYNIGLMKSVEETLEIAEKAEVAVHISHIKALGKDVWGKSSDVVKMIEDARKKGLKVTASQYPYLASRTNFSAVVIPRWAEDGGYEMMLERFNNKSLQDTLHFGIRENIRRRGGPETLFLSSAKDETLNGISLQEIAAKWDVSPTEAVIKILKEDGKVSVVSFNMNEEDLHRFMIQDWVMTDSDGTPGHPRKYGAFSIKMRKYFKEEGLINLPFLLHNQTILVAETFGFEKRGRIKEGYFADLILFDPEEVRDHATFEEPSKLATGMTLVFVNGKIAIRDGEFTGEYAGRALKHK